MVSGKSKSRSGTLTMVELKERMPGFVPEVLTCVVFGYIGNPWAFTWEVTGGDTLSTLPWTDDGKYDFVVEWGEGHISKNEMSHTYSAPGQYTVYIDGLFEGVQFKENDDCQLLDISQWGCCRFGNGGANFQGCEQFTTISATDAPDLSGVTNMNMMFAGASSFNGDLSRWNTDVVTNMGCMFSDAFSFNGNLSTWDTVAVTDMNNMFSCTTSFDGDLSRWNTASVTNMESMFYGAFAFNGDINTWNTVAVMSMRYMFCGASSFNGDLSSWNTAAVTDMRCMFGGASSFNGDLSSWNTAAVMGMNSMFCDAVSFNGTRRQ